MLFACEKFDVKRVIKIKTQSVFDIASDSAKALGEIIDQDENEIIEYGHCWSSTDSLPTMDLKTKTSFDELITEEYLKAKWIVFCRILPLYVRAYAANVQGTIYGEVVHFTTLPSVASLSTI